MGAHEKSEGGGGGPNDQEYPQSRITFAALFYVLQIILIISGVAVGLSQFSCASTVKSGSTTWKAVGFYYFRGNCSRSYTVNEITYTLAGNNNASQRTAIILWVYIGVTVFWFIGSVLLLMSAAKGKHMKPNKGRCLHIIWLLSTIFMLAYDGITAIIYLVDLSFLNTPEDFNDFLQILPVKTIDFKTKIPPIIMAALFSKGIILWLIDGILIIVIWKQIKILQEMRARNQWVKANLSTTPTYLLPPQLQQHEKLKNPTDSQHVPTLPRLMNVNGKFVGNNQTEAGNTLRNNRPSALQKAARQGFNYEDPSSRPWSTPASENPLTPGNFNFQEFSYGGAPPSNYGQGYLTEPNGFYGDTRKPTSHRNRERPASLQQGPEVFY